ncbi:hypothetical protein [Streptomyces sp. NPDC054804]
MWRAVGRRQSSDRRPGVRRQLRRTDSATLGTLYDGWNDSGATNAALVLNATARLAGAS